MSNYLQYSMRSPYHLSVGAVLLNDAGEVACHHFTNLKTKGAAVDDGYIVMRESVELGESYAATLARGLQEEFGMQGEIQTFLGPTVQRIKFLKPDAYFEKTTLYFLCRLTQVGQRDPNDQEADTIIEWHKPAELIQLMRHSGAVVAEERLDEPAIIERAVAYIAGGQPA